MIRWSISELSTFRSDLSEEIRKLSSHGFEAISLWRTKLSDVGPGVAREMLTAAGIRVSSLLWGGGFTGGDGRSFRESVDDVLDGIDAAAEVGTDVLVVHAGCRGGHTIGHARRLLGEALRELAPAAESAGVTIAVKPMHEAAGEGCGFLTSLSDAVAWLEDLGEPAVKLSVDAWQFADVSRGRGGRLAGLSNALVQQTAVVQLADRLGPPSRERDRLPPGFGNLPLERIVSDLVELGYGGGFEFDCVGESVETIGYDGLLRRIRLAIHQWAGRLPVAGGLR